MGADIHVFVETKDDDGRWTMVPCPTEAPASGYRKAFIPSEGSGLLEDWYWPRSYYLFGLLAGVRGPGPQIKPCTGLPADVSQEVHDEFSNSGYHSVTCYTVTELFDYFMPHGKVTAVNLSNSFMQFLLDLTKMGLPESYTRLVIGFDS